MRFIVDSILDAGVPSIRSTFLSPSRTRYGPCDPSPADSAPAEDDASVGDGLHLVLGWAGVGVVPGAEQASVFDVGLAALGPGDVVVDVAHRCGPFASVCGAVLVADPDRDPLVLEVEPALASDVEDLGVAAEHHRDDPGLAGEL